jgi:hypothetical protein
MRLVEPTLGEIMGLVAGASQDEREQYRAIFGREWDVDEVSMFFFRQPGLRFVLLDDDGTPLAAGGYTQISPGVWHDWMVGSESAWETRWRSITRACRLVMDRLFAEGAVRLQTAALASRTKACEWYVKGLKMHYVDTVKGYAADGQDVVLYERNRPGADHGR